MSILSFPDRGHWGNSQWRGNCSGHIYKSLFDMFKPKLFVDPMMGSATSIEVAKEFGINAIGLDLHSGFNALRMSILDAIGGQHADLIVSHPPYGDLIRYSGDVWGKTADPDDLSQCKDPDDFHEKMVAVLLNQRDATVGGGVYGCIIGDQRKNGEYRSYQAELIARMPTKELAGVLIKAQHNTRSESKQYGNMKGMPFISHEYILLWKKPSTIQSWLGVLNDMCQLHNKRYLATWKSTVRAVLASFNGVPAKLGDIYSLVEAEAADKVKNNKHYRDKIRQVLNQNKDEFFPAGRGVWILAEAIDDGAGND